MACPARSPLDPAPAAARRTTALTYRQNARATRTGAAALCQWILALVHFGDLQAERGKVLKEQKSGGRASPKSPRTPRRRRKRSLTRKEKELIEAYS